MNIRLLKISSNEQGRMARISIRKCHFNFQGIFLYKYEFRNKQHKSEGFKMLFKKSLFDDIL
jgi:hypothetical protein